MITAAEIADRLSAQIETVARELLPDGQREGNEWCVGSTDGEKGKSCKIHLTGEKAGVWKDFAGGDGGDALDLWAAVRGCDISEAMRQAREFLGIADEPPQRKKEYKKPEAPRGARALKKAPTAIGWLAEHGITEATARTYKVGAAGETVLYFPFIRDNEVVHLQYRDIADKRFWASADTMPCLFGWQAIPDRARVVVICEGMKDAMSWLEYGHAALSVPFGAGTGKKQSNWIEVEYERLQRFDRIYLSMDADEAGEAAVADIVERLGRHRCFIVRLPDGYNDCNDCLTGNKGQSAPVSREVIKACLANARTQDPSTLLNVGDFKREIVEQFYPPGGRPRAIATPWRVHDGVFDFILGATTVLAGWSGSGKTTAAGQIILSAVQQGYSSCVASLEFRVPRYMQWLVRQGLANAQPTPDAIDAAVDKLSDNLWAFAPGARGEQGSATLEKILSTWEYAGSRYGAKLFILDNLSKITFSGDEKRQLSEQGAAITQLTEFSVRTNTHVIVVAHSRKKSSEHEEVSKLDVKGSGTITDLSDNVVILHRNRKKELAMKDFRIWEALPPEEQARIEHQADAWFEVVKNRHGDDEPRTPLYFDKHAKLYTDAERAVLPRYL